MVQLHLPMTANIRCTAYDDQWHSLGVSGPLYWDDEERIYPHPTAYSDSSGTYLHSLSYNEPDREWIYKLGTVCGEGITLEIHAYARSIPFWIGKAEGPYIIHGACKINEDIDTWGAFWDLGFMEASLTMPDSTTRVFSGGFLFDRADHRVHYSPTASGAGCGAPLCFSALGLQQEELSITIVHSVNPSPLQPPVPFQHQGRINFPLLEEDYTFDGFEYSDNGGLQPTEHYLTGSYEAGEVDLTGSVDMFLSAWPVCQGTYWDPDASHVWGRAYINWQGSVTIHGETIPVNAPAIGEFTRYLPGAAGTFLDPQTREPRDLLTLTGSQPNPVTSSALIRYSIPTRAHVTLRIYNLLGQEVRTLVDAQQTAAQHEIPWDGRDNGGQALPTGNYMLRLLLDGNASRCASLLLMR